jgi:hypothetical protein
MESGGRNLPVTGSPRRLDQLGQRPGGMAQVTWCRCALCRTHRGVVLAEPIVEHRVYVFQVGEQHPVSACGCLTRCALDLAYFTGCALWTSLTVPFLLNETGFVIEELEPWQEDGETWRRLRATFPERIACQNREQVFYFGPDGLLHRHDYNVDSVAGVSAADYTDDHQIFGGISFPTLRRAVRRLPDGLTEPEPAFFAVGIADVTVASRE